MYGGPSILFLRYKPLKHDVTIFDPFSVLKMLSRHFPKLVCENEKLNCFDIQCVVEASSSSLNYNTTLESKENYPQHTKTVQNLLGFMPEVKALHKPRGDLVLCAHSCVRVPWKYIKVCGYSNLFSKTWTKCHWPLDDLWTHICWGHIRDSTQGSLCPSPMGIHQCMWIQWSTL